MRTKLAFAIAAALGLGGVQVATAADMPVKARAPVAVAAPAWNWTGCYVGVNGGGGWGTKSWRDPNLAGIEFSNHHVSGGLAGGQIGCNYQTSSYVFGLEGEADWANIQGSALDTLSAGTLTDHSKIDFIATFAGRFGLAWGRALLYVKGGGAYAHDKYWTIVNASGATFYSASQGRTGWLVGVGSEYAFDSNWSGKLEYDYIDFGTHSATFAGGTFPGAPFPFDINQRVSLIKVGVNYRFGAR